MGVGFVIWAGIPLFWAVAPVKALAEGDGRWNRVRFGRGRCQGEHGGLGDP